MQEKNERREGPASGRSGPGYGSDDLIEFTLIVEFWLTFSSLQGGQGFLGQHIIRMLQDDDNVKEIRVLDIKPFTNRLGNIRMIISTKVDQDF